MAAPTSRWRPNSSAYVVSILAEKATRSLSDTALRCFRHFFVGTPEHPTVSELTLEFSRHLGANEPIKAGSPR